MERADSFLVMSRERPVSVVDHEQKRTTTTSGVETSRSFSTEHERSTLLRIQIVNRPRETESWYLAIGRAIAGCDQARSIAMSHRSSLLAQRSDESTLTSTAATKTTTTATTTKLSDRQLAAKRGRRRQSVKGGVGMVLQQKEKMVDPVVVDQGVEEVEVEEEVEVVDVEQLLARANGMTSRYRQKSDNERESLAPILSMLASGKRKLETGILDSLEFTIMLDKAEEFERSVSTEINSSSSSSGSSSGSGSSSSSGADSTASPALTGTTSSSLDFTTRKHRGGSHGHVLHQHSSSTVERTTELWEADAGAMIYSNSSNEPKFKLDLGATSCMNIDSIDSFPFIECAIGKVIGFDTSSTSSSSSSSSSTVGKGESKEVGGSRGGLVAGSKKSRRRTGRTSILDSMLQGVRNTFPFVGRSLMPSARHRTSFLSESPHDEEMADATQWFTTAFNDKLRGWCMAVSSDPSTWSDAAVLAPLCTAEGMAGITQVARIATLSCLHEVRKWGAGTSDSIDVAWCGRYLQVFIDSATIMLIWMRTYTQPRYENMLMADVNKDHSKEEVESRRLKRDALGPRTHEMFDTASVILHASRHLVRRMSPSPLHSSSSSGASGASGSGSSGSSSTSSTSSTLGYSRHLLALLSQSEILEKLSVEMDEVEDVARWDVAESVFTTLSSLDGREELSRRVKRMDMLVEEEEKRRREERREEEEEVEEADRRRMVVRQSSVESNFGTVVVADVEVEEVQSDDVPPPPSDDRGACSVPSKFVRGMSAEEVEYWIQVLAANAGEEKNKEEEEEEIQFTFNKSRKSIREGLDKD